MGKVILAQGFYIISTSIFKDLHAVRRQIDTFILDLKCSGHKTAVWETRRQSVCEGAPLWTQGNASYRINSDLRMGRIEIVQKVKIAAKERHKAGICELHSSSERQPVPPPVSHRSVRCGESEGTLRLPSINSTFVQITQFLLVNRVGAFIILAADCWGLECAGNSATCIS